MTAINVALARDRALIVTDELISGGPVPLSMSKCLPFPHLRLVAAVAGHHVCALEVMLWLGSGQPTGQHIGDVVAALPAVLRAAWTADRLTASTTVHLVGITPGDVAVGYALDSTAGFEPRQLVRGVHLSPKFNVEAVTDWRPVERTEPAAEATAAAPVEWRWQDATRFVVDAVARQRTENPERIGGRVQTCLLTPDSIYQGWRDVPEHAAT